MKLRRALLAVGVSLLAAAPASALTLELEHKALERLLATRLMTDGGRLYLDGSALTPCRYAFVQEPRVDAEAGRLRVTFLFSGRQGADVRGRCVGPGANFDLRVSGVPRHAAGEILLDELKLEAPGEPFFAVVQPLLEAQLAGRMRFPVQTLLGHAAYSLSTALGVQLTFENANVSSIEVGERALRLLLEAKALVR